MLNFIYYPISGIMWVWHWLFSRILPNSPGWDGISWSLSVVFLVFSLRILLYKPFVKQISTQRKMQEISPQMQALRKKYGKDRAKLAEEMQKLQKDHGFNPLLGCLPMLVQIPVFIGLFHVLRSFKSRDSSNYYLNSDLVQNFLDARFCGVPLSSFVTQPENQWKAFGEIDFTRTKILIVVIPLMVIAALATHLNSRASVKRQTAEALENPQTRLMNNLALYIFPLGILVSGIFFPVAILIYWVSNNVWTYGQQHVVFSRIEKEEEQAKQVQQEINKANAPKPGVKPINPKKKSK